MNPIDIFLGLYGVREVALARCARRDDVRRVPWQSDVSCSKEEEKLVHLKVRLGASQVVHVDVCWGEV